MKSGIYRITCMVNDRMYIGKSLDIWKRIGQHFDLLDKGKHHCKLLQENFDHHGVDSFLASWETFPAQLLGKWESVRIWQADQKMLYNTVRPVKPDNYLDKESKLYTEWLKLIDTGEVGLPHIPAVHRIWDNKDQAHRPDTATTVPTARRSTG